MNIDRNYKNNYAFLISILFLALFSNIRFQFDFALLRLFDILTIVFFIYIFNKEKHNNDKSYGFYYLIPFFILHILLSYQLGFKNFLREFLQMVIILFFATIILKSKDNLNFKQVFRLLLVFSSLIILYTIYFHLSKGYYVGWKQLPDTRIAYVIFTILFFLYFKIFSNDKKFTFFILSLMLFTILVLSGERKAIAVFIFLLCLYYFSGIGIKSAIILIALYVVFSISNEFITNPYIKDKIETTLNIMNTGNYEYVMHTGQISDEDTYSNAQRAFSINVSKTLIYESPLFGVGTNNYINYVNENYSYLPKFMKLGIHGEFQRVVVENGIIGFLLYLFIWVKSLSRFKLELNKSVHLKFISKEQYKYLIYSTYLPIIFFVGTEASSTRSFILLSLISILPDIVSTINQNRNIKKKENL